MSIHLALCLACPSFPLIDTNFAATGETAYDIPHASVR